MSRTDTYTVMVGKIGTSMVVTTPPPASVAAGQGFTFAGYLKDAGGNGISGKTVTLFVNDAQQVTCTTDSNGMWSWVVTLVTPGTHSIYAKFDGDSTYEGC